MIRRLIALFLMLTLGSFTLEESVADVHDGDAPAAELAKAGSGTGSNAPIPAGQSTHTVHVCHCVHAHGVVAPDEIAPPAQPHLQHLAFALDEQAPPPVDLDVHLRPPIFG